MADSTDHDMDGKLWIPPMQAPLLFAHHATQSCPRWLERFEPGPDHYDYQATLWASREAPTWSKRSSMRVMHFTLHTLVIALINPFRIQDMEEKQSLSLRYDLEVGDRFYNQAQANSG